MNAIAVRGKPIPFSGPMVRAILEGRKTVTRRVVKPQPHFIESSGRWCWPLPKRARFPGCCTEVVTASREWWEYAPKEAFPFAPGDRLWAREAWRVAACYDKQSGSKLTGKLTRRNVQYEVMADEFLGSMTAGRYRHARFMPRWASRITLEVVSVRVERVQEIGMDDIVAEGAVTGCCDGHLCDCQGGYVNALDYARVDDPLAEFAQLWDSINLKRGYGWESNPWVWRIEFKKVEAAK